MLAPSGRRRALVLLVVALVSAAAGCSAVLGLGDYAFDGSSTPTEAGGDDAAPLDEASAEAGEAGCDPNVDLTKGCYACEAVTNDQYLNACTDGTCVQFDSARVAPFLTSDGGLPPLPTDGG